jgi:hypothetical protein
MTMEVVTVAEAGSEEGIEEVAAGTEAVTEEATEEATVADSEVEEVDLTMKARTASHSRTPRSDNQEGRAGRKGLL